MWITVARKGAISIHVRLSDRVEALALKVWRNHITNMIHTAAFEWSRDNSAVAFLHRIREKRTHFEDEILRLKEVTSILQLAVWNLKLNKTIHQDLSTRHQKKTDETDIRRQCRISCGTEVVIGQMCCHIQSLHSRQRL